MHRVDLKELMVKKVLVIDGAMGTQIQTLNIPKTAWQEKEGCNEILNITLASEIQKIHEAYLKAGADIIKTNTFGAIAWVLDDYDIGERSYELAYEGARVAKKAADKFYTKDKPRFVAGDLGPGTKLPSLGHIEYDEMYDGYSQAAKGLIDGGCDLFLLETCQDPLQIKAALHACFDTAKEKGVDIPVMVSVTIELAGTMLIGTDVKTISVILEPFDLLSLGFNCGTGPKQVQKHVKTLSRLWNRPISVHANAGLPQNRGGQTFYPMGPKEFADFQKDFLKYDGVSLLGGCCGTTPQHIKALSDAVKEATPKPPSSHKQPKALASLFETRELIQKPPPFLIGERSNATGSKAFRELLLKEDYEGTLFVAQQQVRYGAHGIDLSVGFAGRDESKDMKILASLYSQKVTLPLMIDSTQTKSIEVGLKQVGGKPIINSVNLEDGVEKFDEICSLAKRFGASLVCLVIDEKGMAKDKKSKVEIAQRIYELATLKHGIDPRDLVFDLLTFTVGSGEKEYFTAAIETIEAIREFHSMHPEVGFVLGVSNISFGLDKHAREYLNSVFLHHCVKAGLSMAIINVKNIIPIRKMSDEDIKVCEDLLFNKREEGDPLFKFIDYFSGVEINRDEEDAAYEKLNTKEKLHKLLLDGDKERMLNLLKSAKEEIAPQEIVNVILIEAMKEVGELFGSGKMQLPFVLQSAETMKAAVDFLNPYLPKKEKSAKTTLVLGTVKGDVHDVGKNLVDIILTNNGFKVINIGIKADIETFLDVIEKNHVDAIGMSGLLVKSTAVMLENLEYLKNKGVKLPVLLGGAALTAKFVDEYCKKAYEGPIFYCKDAFDGMAAMSRIEEGNFDTNLGGKKEDKSEVLVKKKSKKEIPSYDKIKMPSRDIVIPTPPFWGRRVLDAKVDDLAFLWINHKMLFNQRWGYVNKKLTKQQRQKIENEKLWPLFEKMKKEIQEQKLINPVALYGYYPCRSDKDTLLIFDPSEGWFKEDEINKEPLETVRKRAKFKFKFPRQTRKPYRCLSDYFRSDRHDVVALQLASAGAKFSQKEQELYAKGEYNSYHHLHGISVELAEAIAEIIHKQIRLELDIAENEGDSLRDVKMSRYHGCRYSFGYAACPDLSMNKELFSMLKPHEFGIELSETFQMHPEQTTSAIVVHHKEALYFAI